MTIDNDVKMLVRGLLLRQFELIRRNQYANAFNSDGSVFELKYEIDFSYVSFMVSMQLL